MEKKISVRSQVAALRKGASLTFPIEKRCTIRNYASELSLSYADRNYTTATDTRKRTIKITRTN